MSGSYCKHAISKDTSRRSCRLQKRGTEAFGSEGLGFRKQDMNHSLNSLKEVYIGDYYRGY